MENSRPICTCMDAEIYDRDHKLFKKGQWINDACINYCYRRLESRFSDVGHEILLLDPAVGSFFRIQCTDPDDYEEFYNGNNISTKRWILIPINDNTSFDESCSHWSLLVMHVPSNTFWHFDSHGTINLSSSRQFADKLSMCVGLHRGLEQEPCKLTNVSFAQQENGSDCGIYVLMGSEAIFNMLVEDIGRCLSTEHRDGVGPGITTISDSVDRMNAWIAQQQLASWSGINDSQAINYRRFWYDDILSNR